MKERRKRTKDVVYIVLEDQEFKVSNKNGMAEELIRRTDMSMPKKDRLSMLDIKGLGMLKYRSRKISRYTQKGVFLIRMKFEQWTKV